MFFGIRTLQFWVVKGTIHRRLGMPDFAGNP